MRRFLTMRPSPSMAVALFALFVALGGSGYAAISIDGKNIKNRSIAAKKLKRNTLTGKEINESKLGTVPAAANSALLGGLGPNAFLGSTAKAADSDKLDGNDSTVFLGKTETAADSAKLGGVAAAGWVQGGGITGVARLVLDPSPSPAPATKLITVPNFGEFDVGCNSTDNQAELSFQKSSSASSIDSVTEQTLRPGGGTASTNIVATIIATSANYAATTGANGKGRYNIQLSQVSGSTDVATIIITLTFKEATIQNTKCFALAQFVENSAA